MVGAPWPWTVPSWGGKKILDEAVTFEYMSLNTHIPLLQVLYYDQESDIGRILILRCVDT